MRVAFVGIDLMIEALKALKSNGCEILKIFSCSVDNRYEFNTEVLQFAQENNIPATLERITQDDIDELADMGCELLICGGYYYKIPVSDRLYMINIHPALLPVGRGAWPMPITILKGLKKSGVTFHKIENSFDTGDIILQKSFEVDIDENLETFCKKFQSLLPDMIKTLLGDIHSLYKNAKPQDKGEYWENPTEEDMKVRYTDDFEKAEKILRAFYGFPCFYEGSDNKYRVFKGVAKKEGKNTRLKLKDGYIVAEEYKTIEK